MLQRKLQSTRSALVEVIHAATAGRSSRKNAEIRFIQKNKYGRDPFFFRKVELRKAASAALVTIGRVEERSRLLQGAQTAAMMLRDLIRRHIESGVNRRGPMPPVKKSTAVRKAKKHGKNLPTLVDTGQLLRSVHYRTREIS